MFRPRTRGAMTACLAAAVGLLVAGPLDAQEAPPPQQMELDSAELDEFAEVYLEVQALNTELQAELEDVDEVTEAQQIQQEYTEIMMDSIRAHDMTPEYYGQVVQALNTDADLRERFTEAVERVREEESGGLI